MRLIFALLLLMSKVSFCQQAGLDSFYRVTVKFFSPFFLENIQNPYVHDTVDVLVKDKFRVYQFHQSLESFNNIQTEIHSFEDTLVIALGNGNRHYYSTYIYQQANALNGMELDTSTFKPTGKLHNIDSVLKIKNIAGQIGINTGQHNPKLTLLGGNGNIQEYLLEGAQEGSKGDSGKIFITTDVTFEGFPLSLSWILDSITNSKVVDVNCQIPTHLLIPREGLPNEILDQVNELPDNIEYSWSIRKLPLCAEQKRMLRIIQHSNDQKQVFLGNANIIYIHDY